SDQSCHHAKQRKSLCRNKIIHSHRQQSKKGSRCINRHVCVCVGKGHFTGSKPVQQVTLCHQKQNRQCHRDDHHHRKTVGQYFPCPLLISCPQANRKKHRSSDPKQRTKG